MEKKTNFKELTNKQKLEYIWDYYRWKIITVIAVAVTAISLIHHYATYTEPLLSIIMVNSNMVFSSEFPGLDEFVETTDIDTLDEIEVDTSIAFSSLENPSSDYTMTESISLRFAVGGNDIIFAPEEIYTYYAASGCMLDLRTLLSDEELEKYKDMLYYTTDETTGETYPCAFILSENNWAVTNGYYSDSCYFGVIYNHDNTELSKEFLDYVLTH